eukprot:TRINITY_DN6775_c2_g1_i9.p1 TRINITY_DN6775_c2_g1~~TRINITY_DN6775_c2_g1_i9.p1  ORF type:complete len:117 (-),score=9.14 TRINITY_DN6775_c2_g1_i9:79-429(-)
MIASTGPATALTAGCLLAYVTCMFNASWGSGDNGRLGHGDAHNRATPSIAQALACKLCKKLLADKRPQCNNGRQDGGWERESALTPMAMCTQDHLTEQDVAMVFLSYILVLGWCCL